MLHYLKKGHLEHIGTYSVEWDTILMNRHMWYFERFKVSRKYGKTPCNTQNSICETEVVLKTPSLPKIYSNIHPWWILVKVIYSWKKILKIYESLTHLLTSAFFHYELVVLAIMGSADKTCIWYIFSNRLDCYLVFISCVNKHDCNCNDVNEIILLEASLK